jgi:hypothetical protein
MTNERIFERQPRRMLSAKGASPGKFTDQRVWFKWKAELENQLAMLYGVNGVLLVYVIREKEEPKEKGRTTTASPKSASTGASSLGRGYCRAMCCYQDGEF